MRTTARPAVLACQLLALTAAVAVLGVAPGEERALETLGALTTFWQPLQVLSGAYGAGERWTRRSRRPAVAVLATTIAFLAGAAVLVLAAQAITGRVGLPALFSAAPRTGLPTFPWLIPLGALQFVILLQITMTCEGKPFTRLPRPWGGWTALAVASALAVAAYFLLVNWDAVPAATRAATGLRNPDGPVPGNDVPAFLIVVAAWQVISLNLLGGWPGTRVRSPAARILLNDILVLAGGTATYLALQAAGVSLPDMAALAGSTVAGSRLVAVLAFRDSRPATTGARLRLSSLALLSSAALWAVLLSVTSGARFTQQPAGLWIAVMALNFVSGGISYLTDILPRARPPAGEERPRPAAGPAQAAPTGAASASLPAPRRTSRHVTNR